MWLNILGSDHAWVAKHQVEVPPKREPNESVPNIPIVVEKIHHSFSFYDQGSERSNPEEWVHMIDSNVAIRKIVATEVEEDHVSNKDQEHIGDLRRVLDLKRRRFKDR